MAGFPDHFKEAQQRFGEMFRNVPSKAFLLGAGCSHYANIPLTDELTTIILGGKNDDAKRVNGQSRKILDAVKSKYANSETSGIEDYLSEIIDYLAIVERRGNHGVNTNSDIPYPINDLRAVVAQIKSAIANIIIRREREIKIMDETSAHRRFVRIAHGLTAGRIRGTTDYLCLNYDTLLEKSLALEGIPYTDGMRGGELGWWDKDTFEPSEKLSARVFKLHGSVNWRSLDGETFPRRIEAVVPDKDGDEFMIWPASTKYRETQRDPYAQLAIMGWESVKAKSIPTGKLLIVCGYRFADDHINGAMEQAVHESKGHLTVVAFVGEEATDKMMGWINNNNILGDNTLVYSPKGFFHGNRQETDIGKGLLPWWKFENFHRMVTGR